MWTSVIIPTYNRYAKLLCCLSALSRSTLPRDQYEVVIVDDGSTDETPRVVDQNFHFRLKYLRQTNQGDAAARNLGAVQSNADVLIFIDDDIVVEPPYIASLVNEQQRGERLIVCGVCHWFPSSVPTVFEKTRQDRNVRSGNILHFTDCVSNNMSIKREHYMQVGMMRGLVKGGSDMWCDVEFSYRAFRQGFSFNRAEQAVCYHDDYAARDLATASQRAEIAARRAFLLFQRHPELIEHIPMFHDKTSINWERDSKPLILRKIARQMASANLSLLGMEKTARLLEIFCPAPSVLRPLYRWIIGGYIFRGYRQGLRELRKGAM